MAKTESTAVNELIAVVQTNKRLVVEPGADLFGTSNPHGAAPDLFGAPPMTRGRNTPSTTLQGPAMSPRAPSPSVLSPSQLANSARASSPTASSAGLTVSSSFSASSAGLTVPSIPPAPPQRASSPSLPPPVPRAPTASSAGLTVPSTFSASSAGLVVPSGSPSLPPPSTPRMTSTIPPMRGAGDVAPLPRSRAPQSTGEQLIPSLHAGEPRVRMGTAQTPRGTTIPPLARVPGGTLPPPNLPVAAPFSDAPPSRQASSASLPIAQQQDLLFPVEETEIAVPSHRTREDNIALAKKLIIPAIAVIAAGIGIGFYVSGKNKAKTPKAETQTTATAPTPTLAPTPSAPPTETVLHPKARSLESANAATTSAGGDEPVPPTKEEQAAQMAAAAAEASGSLTSDAPADAMAKVQGAKSAAALTDVRIDTDPQGASIILVDRGKQFPLGSTPLSTSLDPSREYEVIVESPGRPSQTVKLAPATMSRLDITLAKKQGIRAPSAAPAASAEPAATAEPAPAPAKAKVLEATGGLGSKIDEIAETKPAKKAEPAKTEAKPEAEPKADAASATTGIGTLMVSSKPPCEIHIDGKSTGLTTPQKAIELPVGKHKITFVNAEAGINKTFSVTVKADQPTKLIQDLTK